MCWQLWQPGAHVVCAAVQHESRADSWICEAAGAVPDCVSRLLGLVMPSHMMEFYRAELAACSCWHTVNSVCAQALWLWLAFDSALQCVSCSVQSACVWPVSCGVQLVDLRKLMYCYSLRLLRMLAGWQCTAAMHSRKYRHARLHVTIRTEQCILEQGARVTQSAPKCGLGNTVSPDYAPAMLAPTQCSEHTRLRMIASLAYCKDHNGCRCNGPCTPMSAGT
jgi:hypothetical protein